MNRRYWIGGIGFVLICLLAGVILGQHRSTSSSSPAPTIVAPSTSTSSVPSVPNRAATTGASTTTATSTSTDVAVEAQVNRFEQIYFSLGPNDTTASKQAELMSAAHPLVSHECDCSVDVPDPNSSIGQARKERSTTVSVLPQQSGDLTVGFVSDLRAQVRLTVRQRTVDYPGTARATATVDPPLTCTVGLVHSRSDWLIDAVAC